MTAVFKPHSHAIQLYWLCDTLTGFLLFAMVVFGPWAFGTTEYWSVWTMNGAGLALGLLLAAKWSVRRFWGYTPARWDDNRSDQSGSATGSRWLVSRLTPVLAVLTLALLAFCLVSALNACSTHQLAELSFVYHRYLRWLPHSLDSRSTWFAFWTCLGLACSFWSISDWLLGKSTDEARGGTAFYERRGLFGRWAAGQRVGETVLPARLRRLLWVLSSNGVALGLEGILQRFFGAGRLLFVLKPRFNPEAVTQFGPYAYRANAAQYFNLVWPVCLGFWWTLHCANRRRPGRHDWLLLGAAVMAACPIVSTSRGGALVCVGLGALAALQVGCSRRESLRYGVAFLAAALGLGFALGWSSLRPRLAQTKHDFIFRQQLYERARPMAADYPWFGTGPGTFESVFQFYRASPDADWPAQLHNDWLETRITFGWIGSGLLGLALATVIARSVAGGWTHGARRLVGFIWLAMAGVLVHARFDFPFQVHSIVFLFVLLCAMIFNRGFYDFLTTDFTDFTDGREGLGNRRMMENVSATGRRFS